MRLRLIRRGALLLPVALVALLAAAVTRVSAIDLDLPVALPVNAQSSVLLATDGSVLEVLHGEQDREVVPLRRVPRVLQDAVVAVEDARFRTHPGIDPTGIARAVMENTRAGRVVQGGSTITQQLVKNTMTGDATTLRRKLREARLALALERRYGKDRILEHYLNTVDFGRGAFGVAAAARRFFGTEVDEVTLPQAALLAAVLRSPSRYDPVANPVAARDRRDLVLGLMAQQGLAPRVDVEAAQAAPLDLAPRAGAVHEAPWFVEHVLEVLRADPAFAVLGADPGARQERLDSGGLRIETTLDTTWQRAAEQAVAATVPEPDDPQAAMVAIDPAGGEVRALVGGRDGAAAPAGFNLATDGGRQPGSTFKPLVLAAALERGHRLDELHPGGARVTVPGGPGEAQWLVTNHEEHDYGELTLEQATAQSVNTVYASLITEVGPEAVADLAERAGVARDLEPLPSLALGAQEVTPLEMASVQATLAAGGVHHEPAFVMRITGPGGSVLYERAAPRGERVLDARTAGLVTQALRGAVTQGTAQRADVRRPLAGKTGTTQDGADAWFTGYTPDLAAAVWIGFGEGRVAMEPPRTRVRVEGGTWPAELFARFALRALADVPANDFPASEEVPDVLAAPHGQATQLLGTAGLLPVIEVGCPDGAPTCTGATQRSGQVWEQSPVGGTLVQPGVPVTLRVYPG